MNQKALFGMSKEELKKVKEDDKREAQKVSTAEKYRELGYDQKDVMSALIKEMRLGNLNEAMYWGRVMKETGDT
jgi:replication-associated recombination protein RarA